MKKSEYVLVCHGKEAVMYRTDDHLFQFEKHNPIVKGTFTRTDDAKGIINGLEDGFFTSESGDTYVIIDNHFARKINLADVEVLKARGKTRDGLLRKHLPGPDWDYGEVMRMMLDLYLSRRDKNRYKNIDACLKVIQKKVPEAYKMSEKPFGFIAKCTDGDVMLAVLDDNVDLTLEGYCL